MEIKESVCADTVERINEILSHLNKIGFINDDQYTYLWALVPAEPRSFYLLPKVHKDRAKCMAAPKHAGRQTHSGKLRLGERINERICKFIDFFSLNRFRSTTLATSKTRMILWLKSGPKSTRTCSPRHRRCHSTIQIWT